MEENITKKEVYEILKKAKKPLLAEDILNKLNKSLKLKDALEKLLEEMELEGLAVRLKRGKYSIPEKVNMFIGYLRTTKQGYGFVTPLGEFTKEDIYIAAPDIKNAIDGDLVLIKFKGKTHKGLEGEIKKVIKRGRNKIVCQFIESNKIYFAVPINKKILVNIIIPPDEVNGAKDGDSVVVEITDWNLSRNGMIKGKVVERLGPLSDPKYNLTMILREFDFPDEFPESVLEEARKIPQEIDIENLEADRENLLDLECFTIDGIDAKDFDDAVSLSIEDGLYKLGVHIADVSYYVKEGSELDKEAAKRTSSLYFPEGVIPMLPPQLSNGICSLNPDTPRRAISVFMWFTKKGKLKKYYITRSIIKSKARLNYDQVQEYFDGKTAEEVEIPVSIGKTLDLMKELAHKLRRKRIQRGCIEINVPEIEVEINDDGEPIDIYIAQRHWSHKLIEEFMIAANETIATFMEKNKYPTLYRVHASPSYEKLDFFAKFVSALGIRVKTEELQNPKVIQRILFEVEGEPVEYVVHNILLRSMMKAQYSPENIGHYGLASKKYLHFTSPIRRYPDLIVHRILSKILYDKKLSEEYKLKLAEELPIIAEHCNHVELKIDSAERDYVALKSAQFMKKYIGQIFEGTISGVHSFGIFIELDEFPVEGRVHVSNLGNDYFIYDEESLSLIGKHTRKIFTIGQKVKVKVIDARPLDREIDFELVRKKGKRKTIEKKKKKKYKKKKKAKSRKRKKK